MEKLKTVRLLVTSPQERSDEVNSIKVIIDDLNKTFGKRNLFRIELVNSGIDAHSKSEPNLQDVNSHRLYLPYDIFVGIIGQKIESQEKNNVIRTMAAIISNGYNSRKEHLIYFNVSRSDKLTLKDSADFHDVNNIKSDLLAKGVLYEDYHSIQSFEVLFRNQLTNLMLNELNKPDQQELPPANANIGGDSLIDRLIADLEKNFATSFDQNMLDQLTESVNSLRAVSATFANFIQSMHWLIERINFRDDQLSRAEIIKDSRVNRKIHGDIYDALSKEIMRFNIQINKEIPNFNEKFVAISRSFSKTLESSSYLYDNVYKTTRSTATELRDSLEVSIKSNKALFKMARLSLPPSPEYIMCITEIEETTKNLTNEMCNGIMLLDEVLIE